MNKDLTDSKERRQGDSVGGDGKCCEIYRQWKSPIDSHGSCAVFDVSLVSLVGCLIHSAQLVCPVPVSATPAAWPSCPITSSFTTPMGSCTHATAPGWAQYGTTYQPIHSPECREREAALWNVWREKMNWMENNGESICVWRKVWYREERRQALWQLKSVY